MKTNPEKIYECEARKLFMRSGEKRRVWVTMTVQAAVQDEVVDFRCKVCHGHVKLHKKLVDKLPAPHIAHTSRADAESCPASLHFSQTAGREPALSANPFR